MARPKGWEPYKLKSGKRVPSVTTITGRFKDGGGITHWAWEQGMAGLDYRNTLDEAASAGTIAHAMVEAHIRGREYIIPAGTPTSVEMAARQAWENYYEWAQQTLIKPANPEMRLVSEELEVGGTLDATWFGTKLAIVDLKTTSGVYPDMLVQIAGYGLLWRENFPDRPLDGGYYLLRISREYGDFSHHHFSELNDAEEQFRMWRKSYDLDKKLRARVR